MDRQRDLLYKQRSRKGPGDRAVRAKQKDIDSRTNRATLLASKRRIPLSEIQEDVKKGAVPKLKTDKEKHAERMEQLKEWKKKRDEAKRIEQQRKKKPFSAGSKGSIFQPQISLPNPGDALVGKSNPLATQKPKSTIPPSGSTGPSVLTSNRPPKPTQNTKPPKQSGPKATQNAKPPKQSGPKAQRHSPPVTRSSSRTASKPQTRKLPSKPSTSGTTRAAKNIRNTASSAPSQKAQGSASKKVKKLSPKATGGKASGQKPKSPQTKEEVERVNPMETKEVEDSSPVADVQDKPPSLPTSQYKHARSSYIPPSPCYISVHPNSAVREVYVNDPAWIPGATARTMTPTSGATCPNFDEAFQVFSPFQFKAGVNSSHRGFAFTFRKNVGTTPRSLLRESIKPPNLNISVDSLGGASSAAENMDTPYSPPPESPVSKAIRRSMGNLSMSGSRVVRERKRSLVVEVDLQQEEQDGPEEQKSPRMEPPLIMDLSKASTEDPTTSNKTPNSGTAVPSPPDSDMVDLTYFRKLHSDVTRRLTEWCRDWEGKLGTLEEQEDISEDVLGQIRTTVGQGQLLMRQKLKQYLGLVEEASKEQRPTTCGDLQGFWDMVYFQVEDVEKKFEQLSVLERNEWKQVTQQPKGRKAKRRVPVASKPSSEESSSEGSERLMAAREKRQASRNRLREMKAAAKRAREGEKSVVTDLPSPKKTKDKEDADVNPFKSSRRRSSRKLRRRASDLMSFDDPEEPRSSQTTPPTANPSVFSPPTSSSSSSSSHRHTSVKSPLPTAQLLSFTPGKAVKKSHCTLHAGTTSSDDQGAFQRMYVSITPTKKLRELAGTDVIMSPARRSVRLAERGVKCSAEKMVLPSLTQVPDDVDFTYHPNSALL